KLAKDDVGTSIGASANPSAFGQPVTFTATVTGGDARPTGTVQFQIDGVNFGNAVSLVNDMATRTSTATLAMAGHTIRALYGGDANDSSSSGALTQTVKDKDTTTTFVTSSINASLFGQPVTFTATVAANAPGADAPTGTVQFQIDGVNFGSAVNLVN